MKFAMWLVFTPSSFLEETPIKQAKFRTEWRRPRQLAFSIPARTFIDRPLPTGLLLTCVSHDLHDHSFHDLLPLVILSFLLYLLVATMHWRGLSL